MESRSSWRQRADWLSDTRALAFALVLLLNLLVAVFLVQGVLGISNYPFDADEANHALPALRMTNALNEGDWGSFVDELYAQEFYPPGGAARLLPIFLTVGPSITAARLVSVASLFLAVLVLFALALEIDPRYGWLAGLVAALLTLTSRPILLYASLSMLETAGLLLSLLFLWAYVRAFKHPSAGRFGLTSGLLAAVFLIKYSYGVVALATVGLAELLLLPALLRDHTLREALRSRWLPLAGPFAAVMLLWFLSPGQLEAFVGYTQPLADEAAWLSVRNFLYYPESVAAHYAPGVLFGLVYAAALVWAFYRRRDPGVRILTLFFLAGMASVMFLNHPPNPRFIGPFVPALHLLTGLMIAAAWGAVRSADKRLRSLALMGLLSVFLLAAAGSTTVVARYRHAHSVLTARVETSPGLAEMARWVAGTVEPGESVLLVNYFDQLSPSVLGWMLALRPGSDAAPVAGEILEPASPEQIAALRQTIDTGEATYLVLVEGSPWGAPFWPNYTAALSDRLEEVDRRPFRLVNFAVGDWLDDNSLDANWEAVKAEARQETDMMIIVYRITLP